MRVHARCAVGPRSPLLARSVVPHPTEHTPVGSEPGPQRRGDLPGAVRSGLARHNVPVDEDAVEAPAESFEDPAAFLDVLISRTARRENSVCDDTAFKTDAELVDAVADFYLKSGDFNGMPIAPTGRSHTALEAAVTENLVQLVIDHDFANPHIRPWPAQNTPSQLEKLRMVLDPENFLSGCLYPTPSGMEGHDLSGYDGGPYSRRRAAGHGDLEFVYFKMDALESYRNDPRHDFSLGD
jgi:hypothetical protein